MAVAKGGQLADGLLEPSEPKKRKVGTSEEKQQAVGSAVGTPPLPLRCSPYPKRGKRKDVRRVSGLAAKDPRTSLPTVVKPKDPDTADSVENPRDKALVRNAARSVVSVSSFTLDGNVIEQCSGIVIGWNVTNKCARILTSSTIINRYDDSTPKAPSFGSSPNYGQEVFVLARGAEESNLMARHGRIKWLEEPEDSGRNYLMLLNCEPPAQYGTGGPVIDHDDGHIVGISSFGGPNCTILGISTILTCIEMWIKFSRIARPAHGLRLRTMELLDVSLQERIFLDHSITSGYIVNDVSAGSTAERLGIRYGDVILSFNGLRDHTLPQLEDYLLSLGWGFLQRSIESSSTVDLELEVYDLLGRTTKSITLPVEFSDGHDWDEKLN